MLSLKARENKDLLVVIGNYRVARESDCKTNFLNSRNLLFDYRILHLSNYEGWWYNVTIETVIEASSWVIMILLLCIYVPKEKIRHAQIAFLAQQVITWAFGFAVVEMRLIEYPVRFFEYATRTSFTFEYFVYPSISVLFVLYYPNGKRLLRRLVYSATYCSVITIIK